MKILFHNYSTSTSTEPLYLHNALSKCGIESAIWADPSMSAYDVFDVNKPDLFVTHFKTLTYDIFEYLKQDTKCSLALNVTGASQSQIDSIENELETNKIKTAFLFTNNANISVKTKSKLHQLHPAADLFNLPPQQGAKPVLPEAIISDKFDENVENCIGEKEVFSLLYITGDGNKDESFDIRVDVKTLPQLYKVYENMYLVGDSDVCCSQLFFDMIMSCHNPNVRCKDQEGFNKFISSVFENTDTEKDDLVAEMRSQIKNKHTPFHRAWRFMKFLGDKNAMASIDKVKNQLPTLLKDF
jgi:hypothetical protein